MRAERHLYQVDGWGVGEVWLRDGVLVQHELPSEVLRAALDAAAEDDPVHGGAGSASAGRASAGGPASANGGARLAARTPAAGPRPIRAERAPDVCARFARHLGGDRVSYDDVEIDLDWTTAFQRELARAARSIPWGEVVSYGELAALAGRPGAARAAGSFCADNRVSLVIPCHRVVGAAGIGGYGPGGLPLKRRLLALEGVDL